VIRSWLLDLLVAALDDDANLSKVRGYAEDSGEGRWTVEAAIENAVPVNAIAAALFARFASRQDDSPAMKAVAAMRNQFGGHAMRTDAPPTTAQAGTKPATTSDTSSGAPEQAPPSKSTSPTSHGSGDSAPSAS
jgi:6-phosphogluconate dehydrogenase